MSPQVGESEIFHLNSDWKFWDFQSLKLSFKQRMEHVKDDKNI